jgi:F-type H+-transporting ATPase subunit alpha
MLVVYIGYTTMGGCILDGLGGSILSINRIDIKWCWLIDSPCASIIARAGVNEPFQTGVLSIDTIIPVGRGQRELILGDRQTGKTSLCLDAIINQKYEKVCCVYSTIGLKAASVVEVFMSLGSLDCSFFVIVLLSSASTAATTQYYCPYSATSIAELFMYVGNQSSFLALDDLSKHANCYREISLVLRRPPGREAYPGEVFFIHSRLLERAAKLSAFSGSGSVSCWPIIETLAGDIGAYIATNVISITDGQIALSQELFNAGFLPAIDVGLSVTRVGSSAQWDGMRLFAGDIKLQLAQYAELKSFSQFAADLPAATRALLDRSARVVEVLKQNCGDPMPASVQLSILSAAPYCVFLSNVVPFDQIKAVIAAYRCVPPWIQLFIRPANLLKAVVKAVID